MTPENNLATWQLGNLAFLIAPGRFNLASWIWQLGKLGSDCVAVALQLAKLPSCQVAKIGGVLGKLASWRHAENNPSLSLTYYGIFGM